MTTEHRAAIFHDIDTERAVQDAKWGGPEHDDAHVLGDWVQYIRDHADRSQFAGPRGQRRKQMVRVAALAVAAIESMDRKTGNVPAAKNRDPRDQADINHTATPDLATIVSKCGDLGIKAIAAMANVSEDDVRRALAQDRAGVADRDRLVADANDQADGRRRASEGLRHVLGLLGLPGAVPLATVDDAERTAAELLANRWVLREDVKLPNATTVQPSGGWSIDGDVLNGPGECRIEVRPWGFEVTDSDGETAAAGVAAMRCAMAIHERRYGGASDPSTVTVQVLTSADIERLTRFLYWLSSSVGWLDVRSIIADSADDTMTSPGAEALAREFVADLLRKNGDDHGSR